jgi:3-oxoacyl-[acyl-carrier protein] reductase
MNELTDRTAVVTGSSRGIGAAIATLFAAEGATVVVHGRDRADTDSVRDRIEAQGGRAVSVIADLTHADEVEAMRELVEDQVGDIDIVVANAGGSPVRPGPLEHIDLADWHASIDANLTATFLTIKAFLPAMKARGHGSIITMSSAAARRAGPQSPMAYAAAKAGIEILTKELAAQTGPDGVRVNCLAPETILTERNLQMIPEAIREQMIEHHPIRRLGTPDDVARAALFLASEQSPWVSGVTLDVAGGSVLV